MNGIFLKIPLSRYANGIINKKGINGILYLTIAPVTVVVMPINMNETIIIEMQQHSKFTLTGIFTLNSKQTIKNNKKHKFSMDAINSKIERLS